jgi:hypothetical protein
LLDTLITSKTRIKLLVKFFLNPGLRGYLRGLEQEFQEGSNAIRLELNRFEQAGLLTTEEDGNRKYFKANQIHPLFNDLNQITRKYIGIDQIIDRVVNKAGGKLVAVYITGKLARGLESSIADLIIVGKEIDQSYILHLSQKASDILKKKIQVMFYSPEEFLQYRNELEDLLLIWNPEPSK